MQLYSLQFVLFIASVLAVYYLVGKTRIGGGQWLVLLFANLVFYAVCGWQNLVFVLFTATTTWLSGCLFWRFELRSKDERGSAESRQQKKAIKQKWQHRKWLVALACLIANFGILSYIKYWNVLLANFGAGESFLASQLLLPLGISFYTFQSMGYLIDVYNGKYEAERNWAKLLLFVSYFPQLIQGPINRFDALASQLCERHSFDFENSRRAFLLIGFGVLKKFAIAELLVKTISMCLDGIGTTTPGSIIVFGILLYSVQQYCDFSGGIDMVRGVSQLFGVRMAENFRQPYFSVSLGDFWRRWHITLGAWMRDYVFYPFALRPSMRRLGEWCSAHLGQHAGRTLPACVANVLVFFLVGLWHGAEAHFIWWGLYNGLVIAAADLASPLFARMKAALRVDDSTNAWHAWRVVRTFVVVNIGWYFDRIYDFGDCLQAFHNTLFNFNVAAFMPTFAPILAAEGRMRFILAAIACLIVLVVSIQRERGVDVGERFLSMPIVFRWMALLALGFLIVFSFAFAPAQGGFIYANF